MFIILKISQKSPTQNPLKTAGVAASFLNNIGPSEQLTNNRCSRFRGLFICNYFPSSHLVSAVRRSTVAQTPGWLRYATRAPQQHVCICIIKLSVHPQSWRATVIRRVSAFPSRVIIRFSSDITRNRYLRIASIWVSSYITSCIIVVMVSRILYFF